MNANSLQSTSASTTSTTCGGVATEDVNLTTLMNIASFGGRCAVASCDLSVGSVALRERPLLRWWSDRAASELLDVHFGVMANIWAAYAQLNESDRAKVLDLAAVMGARYDQFIEMVLRRSHRHDAVHAAYKRFLVCLCVCVCVRHRRRTCFVFFRRGLRLNTMC
jgi:hypothetical protein